MHSYMLANFSMQQKCTHISLEKLACPPRKFWAASGPGTDVIIVVPIFLFPKFEQEMSSFVLCTCMHRNTTELY